MNCDMPISYRDLMLATPAPASFSRPGWLFELKYDGFRTARIVTGEHRARGLPENRAQVRLYRRGVRCDRAARPQCGQRGAASIDCLLHAPLASHSSTMFNGLC